MTTIQSWHARCWITERQKPPIPSFVLPRSTTVKTGEKKKRREYSWRSGGSPDKYCDGTRITARNLQSCKYMLFPHFSASSHRSLKSVPHKPTLDFGGFVLLSCPGGRCHLSSIFIFFWIFETDGSVRFEFSAALLLETEGDSFWSPAPSCADLSLFPGGKISVILCNSRTHLTAAYFLLETS